MVWSNDMQFEVVLYNPKINEKNNTFKEMTTPEGLYVIAAPGDDFQIQVFSESQEYYAAVVIIDGYKMPQPKTFRRSGKFLGFKAGPTSFKSFQFQRPQHDQLSINKFLKNVNPQNKFLDITNCHENDKTDYNGGTGEIVVKIYKTIDVPRKPSSGEPREPRQHTDPEFQPFTFNDDKSGVDQALGIAAGDVFSTGGGGGGGGGDRPMREGDGVQHKPVLEEEGLVASFRILYTDVFSLIHKKYINLDFPQHLTLLPQFYFKGNELALLHVMQTIVKGGRAGNPAGAKLEDVIQRCGHWIKFPIHQLINSVSKMEEEQNPNEFPSSQSEEEELTEFFKKHDSHFIIDPETNCYKIKEAISKKNYPNLEQGEI